MCRSRLLARVGEILRTFERTYLMIVRMSQTRLVAVCAINNPMQCSDIGSEQGWSLSWTTEHFAHGQSEPKVGDPLFVVSSS